MPNVAQFKRVWLSGTETAIDNHVRSLRRHGKMAFAEELATHGDWGYPVHLPPSRCGRGLRARLSRGRRMSGATLEWYSLELLCRDVGLMHVHFGTDGFYYMPVARAADVPLLVTFHGHDAYRFPNAMYGLGLVCLRKLFREAARILTVSDHMRMHLCSLGCPSEKLQTVRVGIDLARFAFRPPKPGPKVRVTCVAGFRPKKGLNYLIEAFHRARMERRDLELVLVGDGPLRPELERKIAGWGLAETVRFAGHVAPDEVARLLAETHIYAQPSVTDANGDCEGIPATVMEAMARGLPVVATRHSGIPELVRDGVTGMLVEERDVDELAESILLLAESPQRWEPMGAAGRERVERLHDIRRQAETIEGIYEDLMEAGDAAAVRLIGGSRREEAAERRAA